ncbi:hypothetical protein [Paenibacillus sp. MMO-58]|uniref:hypothetical protein n=1 Tax=Paenibacillus sp. MMO-58 TaxID=3081290 RepID=UPI003019C833
MSILAIVTDNSLEENKLEIQNQQDIRLKNKIRRRKKNKLLISKEIKRKKVQRKIIKRRAKKHRSKKRTQYIERKEQSLKSFHKFIEKSKFNANYNFDKKVRMTRKGQIIVEIPSSFSLINNPDECIEVYKKIYQYGMSSSNRGLYFDHSQCKDLELGASAVMDVLAINVKNYHKRMKRRFNFSGELPDDQNIKMKLYVSGLLKHLGINNLLEQKIKEENKNLQLLELVRGGHHSTTMLVKRSNNSGTATTEVINYFDRCVRTQGFELSLKGKNYFGRLIGEVINNCEQHSGDFCQWFALGHYDVNEDGYGECSLVLFNFGKSIYENMKSSTIAPDIKNALDRLTKIHKSKWFRIKKEWDEEVLWTLYALQEGVSRLRSTQQKDRGVGTIKLIESFQTIGCTVGGKTPEMSIISGNAFILFNNEYELGEVDVDGHKLRRIAFNESNDLEQPPNPRNVKKLKNFFPGTIVTMKLFLDKTYLKYGIDKVESS